MVEGLRGWGESDDIVLTCGASVSERVMEWRDLLSSQRLRLK